MSGNWRSQSMDYNSLVYDDVFMTRPALIKKSQEAFKKKPSSPDCVDAEVNRRVAEIKPDRASILDSLFAIGAIGTFVADIVTDVLVAKQHYENGDKIWFSLTCIFIILPSLIMQIFSCKWFLEDSVNATWWNYLVHCCQLGTIQRYIRAFWYGLRTRQKSARQTDYICYLTEWRDICLLRLFEGFLEAAPQMILQLYILTIQSEFIVERDWLTATSAIVSIISLSWAIVSYSQMLRLCLNSKIFSVFGYCFQISYRLLMVASRVIVLVLFASAFKFYIFVFIVGHSAMMFGWLCCIDMISRARSEGRDLPFLDKIFTFIVSIIYLFCFLNVHPSTTKRDISMYYCVVFIENAGLMAAWYPYRTLDGVLMYAAVGVVFGGFIVGLIFMLLYYRYFHPNEDITAGWLCCPFATRRPGDTSFQITDDALVSIVENGDLVIVNRKGEKSNAVKRTISASGSDKSIPLELIRPHSPAKVDRASNNREDMQISEIADSLREHSNYGTIDSSLASNCRSDRKRPSGEAQNGSKACKKEGRNCHMGSQEDGAKHRWTARISKQTEFHRLYDQAGLLEEKGELANLHFDHEEHLESIDKKSHDNSKHADAELGRKVKWQVEVSRQPRDEARESLDASRLIEHQKSKDDSGIRFCGVSRRRKEREDWRWSLDEIDATKVKQSSRVAGQKQNYGHEDVEQEFIFSDTNLNSVERAPHLT